VKPHPNPARPWHQAASRQDLERSRDRHRDDLEAELLRHAEAAALEGAETSVAAARSLGKEDHRDATGELRLGGLETGQRPSRVGAVDEDVTDCRATPAEEGHLAQLLLDDPAELAAQIAVKGEDVVVALVVGQEDIGASRLDLVASLDAHPHEAHLGQAPGPDRATVERDALVDERQRDRQEPPQDGGEKDHRIEHHQRPGDH